MQLTIDDRDAVRVPEGFDAFFHAHFASVARAAALVAGDPATGQDLAQDAFLRLLQRWESMRSREHARNFVYKVAINLARSHLRKHLRLVPSGLHHADRVAAAGEAPGEGSSSVADALADLSPRQRACVVLVDLVGMDSGEVARVLSINANTVRVHVMRGRAALRARLGMEERDEA